MSNTLSSSSFIQNLSKSLKADFFVGDNGEPCISLTEGERTKSFILNSEEWRAWLVRYCHRKDLRSSDSIRANVIEELTAMALGKNEKKSVYVRVGKDKDDILIDTNNDDYQTIRINKNGFKVLEKTQVPFIRSKKQMPLPLPTKVTRKEFLQLFERAFRVSEDDRLLILAFILKCLHRDLGSYVIMVVDGQQGSGKTTFSNRVKSIIDPSRPSSYSPPSNPDDIIVASAHSFLLVYDNISGIDGKMSDIFCRLSTGGGISKRKLYENHGETFYVLHRPCLLNGISEPTNRADFLDRSITISLEPLENSQRIAESSLNSQFETDLPKILGGLYDILSDCLSILPSVQTTDLPRMTDFARIGIALESALKLKQGTFLKAYERNRSKQSDEAFWTDDLCCAIYDYFNSKGKSPFSGKEAPSDLTGTSSEIFTLLTKGSKRHRLGNISARAFSGWLERITPLLKSKGYLLKRLPRSAGARKLKIYLKE